MINIDSVLNSRDITLPTNVHIVKAMIFPVVTYGCENWTVSLSTEELMLSNNAGEDLRVPWTARRSNQSVLKEFNLEYSLEGLLLKLRFQYFDHLIRRADSLAKILMLGKTKGQKRME